VRNESEHKGRAVARGSDVVTHIFPILGEIGCLRRPIRNRERMSDIEVRCFLFAIRSQKQREQKREKDWL